MKTSILSMVTRTSAPCFTDTLLPLLLLLTALPAHAETDIANSPLATTDSVNVKPNVLFILDDSGSMKEYYMPDAAGWSYGDVGFRSHLCNSIYYNPGVVYEPPMGPNGVDRLPASTFSEAWNNGYSSNGYDIVNKNGLSILYPYKEYAPSDTKKKYKYGPDDLNSKFRAWEDGPDGNSEDFEQPAYYYKWKGAPGAQTCSTDASNSYPHSTGATKWEKVQLKNESPEQQQNFANWYSYYRTRMLTMKAAGGEAFASLNSDYRVGFVTINFDKTNAANRFLPVADFSQSQKDSWYQKLYKAAEATGGTPLRLALSRAGRYYGAKSDTINDGMSVNPDPVEYSCQRNYSILTTDGYWNGGGGVELDGKIAMGNWDNNLTDAPRPLFDAGKGTTEAKDTLADAALYYYMHDLRDDMANEVSPSGTGPEADTATHQHMTTFTMGLGVNGTLAYQADYKTAATGDFALLRSYDNKVNKNWPKPVAEGKTAVDDLWHAAVNGRGRYFSAKDPKTAAASLLSALNEISAAYGNGSSVTATSPYPISGDNLTFTSAYQTGEWWGDIEQRQITLFDADAGKLSAPQASAKTFVDDSTKADCDNRKIYLFRSGAADNRVDFTWGSYSCKPSGARDVQRADGLDTDEQKFFDKDKVKALSQYSLMTDGTNGTKDQVAAAANENMVNFIRGQRKHETFVVGDDTRLYRPRAHLLGDIIDSQPAYVGKPYFEYRDTDYATFQSDNANRTKMVYVAANDGMLHAFDAETLEEQWAFIPTMALPQMHMLADNNYGSRHRYIFDGSPVVGDIYSGSKWSTILVTAMGRGAKGYLAVDITDPANPKGLWEFKYSSTCYAQGNAATHSADCHLGLSIGEARIAKLVSGKWVVLLTSGLNNVNNPAIAGDGQGYLYVLDAATGKILKKISTGVGDAANPSGLSKVSTYSGNVTFDDTPERIYAGDLEGNVWRFDINDIIPPAGFEATKIAELRAGGVKQPVTAGIAITEVGSPSEPMVLVGTGRYYGASDVKDKSVQTMYGFRDRIGAVVTRDDLVEQKLVTSTDKLSRAAEDCADSCEPVPLGWYIDLPDSGERVNVDPIALSDVVVFISNVPANIVCKPGGEAWLNYVDPATGREVTDSPGLKTSTKTSGGIVSGLTLVELPTRDKDGNETPGGGKTIPLYNDPDSNGAGEIPRAGRRLQNKTVSWREIVD